MQRYQRFDYSCHVENASSYEPKR